MLRTNGYMDGPAVFHAGHPNQCYCCRTQFKSGIKFEVHDSGAFTCSSSCHDTVRQWFLPDSNTVPLPTRKGIRPKEPEPAWEMQLEG